MEKIEFAKGMKFLGLAFDKEFTKDKLEVWYDFFKNDSYDSFRTAVKRLVPKNKFLPSISEIKQEIAVLENPLLQLDVDEEWDKAISTIRKYGRYKQKEIMANLEPYSKDVIRQIGIETICNSEDITWQRKQFYSLFNNMKDNYEEIAVIGEPQYTLSELTRKAKIKQEERLLLDSGE